MFAVGIFSIAFGGIVELNKQKKFIESDVENRIGTEIRRYYPDLKFLISCDALVIEEQPAIDETEAKDLVLPGVKGFESDKDNGAAVISVERIELTLLLDKYEVKGNKDLTSLLENIAFVAGKLSHTRGDKVNIMEMVFPVVANADEDTGKKIIDSMLNKVPNDLNVSKAQLMSPFEFIGMLLLVLSVAVIVFLMRRNKINAMIFRQEMEKYNGRLEEIQHKSGKEIEHKIVNVLPEHAGNSHRLTDIERMKNSLILSAVGRPYIIASVVKEIMNNADHKQKLQIVLSQFGPSLLSVIKENITKQEHSILNQMGFDNSSRTSEEIYDALSFFYNQIQIKQCTVASEEEQNPFSFLSKLSESQLYLLIKNESPGIVAMVLSQLESGLSANLLRSLSSVQQGDVAIELANLHRLTTDIFIAVAREMAEKASKIPTLNNIQVQGTDLLMDIFDNIDEHEENAINDSIKVTNMDLYKQITSQRFSFLKLNEIDDRVLRQIMKDVPGEEMAVALKNAPDHITDKFLSVLPSKAKSILNEQIDTLKAVSEDDEQKVRRRVTKLVRNYMRVSKRM